MLKNITDYQVQIPVCALGGFGDIIAGIAIGEYFRKIGLPFELNFSSEVDIIKFGLVLGEEAESWIKKETPKKRKKISVCPVIDKRRFNDDTFTLLVSEYDRIKGYNNDKTLTLRTGLGFEPINKHIQAGIYCRESLDFLLQTVSLAVSTGNKDKLKEELLAGLIEDNKFDMINSRTLEELAKSRWALAYSSNLNNDWYYFDILDTGIKKSDAPLLVFSTAPQEAGARDSVNKKVFEAGFNYYDFTNSSNGNSVVSNSPITCIELGIVSDSVFRQLVAYADTLSLVTGDHSLSQMIQKSLSEIPVPFFYQKAFWKSELALNFAHLMNKTSKRAAKSFEIYSDPQTAKSLASLVYDQDTIVDYNAAVRGIKSHFIAERREAGVEKAELLWNVQETIGYIVQGFLAGKDLAEATKGLRVPKK